MSELSSIMEHQKEVILKAVERGFQLHLVLGPAEVVLFHGMVALTMQHPEIREQRSLCERLGRIKQECTKSLVEMGFTAEEVDALDS